MRQRARIVRQIFIISVASLALSAPAGAGTLYEWTDSHNNKHFSDRPPPTGTEFTVIETSPQSSEPTGERQAFDQMIENAREESKRYELEQQRKREEEQARENEKKQATREAIIQAQRQELENQIKALENRALSPTFSQGMRNSQIEAIKKQIKQLESVVKN